MRVRTVVVAVSMVMGAMAAPAAAQEVHVGALGGFGLTRFAFSPAPPADFTKPVRPTVGGLVSVDLTETIGFETRIVWQRKAIQWQQAVGGLTATATAQVDYLSVPVLVRLAAPRGTVRPYAIAGAEFSFKTRAHLAGSSSDPSFVDAVIPDEEFGQGIRKTDVAFDVGGGLEIPAGRVSLLVEGLYSHGLLNVPEGGSFTEFEKAKARTFRVSAGIRF